MAARAMEGKASLVGGAQTAGGTCMRWGDTHSAGGERGELCVGDNLAPLF
jgi:hypothetical protein